MCCLECLRFNCVVYLLMLPTLLYPHPSHPPSSLSSLLRSVGCTVVEMLTGKPPLHDLEPFAAMYKIGNEPEKFRSFLSLSCSERVEYFLSQCFAV